MDITDLEVYTSSIHKVDISRVKEESGYTGRLHEPWLFKSIKRPGGDENSLVRAIGQGNITHPFSRSTLTEIWMREDSLFHMTNTVLSTQKKNTV